MPSTRSKKKKTNSANTNTDTDTNINTDIETGGDTSAEHEGDKVDKANDDKAADNTKEKVSGDNSDSDNRKDQGKRKKRLRFASFGEEEPESSDGDDRRTLTTRPELTLKRIYYGGTDLNGFEREFWRISEANRWPKSVQVAMLCENLAGLAKPFAETVLEEAVESVSARDLFVLLRMEFMKQSALALSQAQVDDMRQGEHENIKVYAARFTKALKASGQTDSGVTAIKFYRSTRAVGVLPFNSKTFVSVRSVADAINDWEQSRAWAKAGKLGRGDAAATPRDEVMEPDDQEVDERPQTRRRTSALEDGPRVQAVQFRNDNSRDLPMFDATTFSDWRGGKPNAQPVEMNQARNEAKPTPVSQMVACQLCLTPGHTAPECGRLSQVQRAPVQCSKCFKVGHTADQCWGNLTCSFCGRQGHELASCYSNPGGASYRGRGRGNVRGAVFRGRGRGYGREPYSQQPRQQDDRRCYECGESGHLSRDCTQPLPRRNSDGDSKTGPFASRSNRDMANSISQVQLERFARTIVREVKLEDDRSASRGNAGDGGKSNPPPSEEGN